MNNKTTPGNVRLNDGLGQLPEPDVCHEMARDDWREDWSYSEEAMRAYAAEQVAAERERCAKICEEHAANRHPPFKSYEDTYLAGWLDASNECTWAIRGRNAGKPDISATLT